MNDKLAEYVRRVSFNINLSKNQIDCLMVVHRNNRRAYDISHWVTGVRKLESIGLVVHHEYPDWKKMGRVAMYTGISTGEFPAYTVTQEGKLICELLLKLGFKEPFHFEETETEKKTDPVFELED